MDGIPTKSLFIVCCIVFSVSVLSIIFLMNAYFSILETHPLLVIDKGEDAIQLSILCVAVATGALIVLYVTFSKQQADAVRKQLELSLTPALICDLDPVIIPPPAFTSLTESGQYLRVYYTISNLTKLPGRYTLEIKQYVLPPEEFSSTIDFTKADKTDYSTSIIKIAAAKTFNGRYERKIQPLADERAYFRIELGPLVDYLKSYTEANQTRFRRAQQKVNATDPEGIFRVYIDGKHSEASRGPLQPDPLWLRFILKVLPHARKETIPIYEFESLYYFKMDFERGDYDIKFVRDFSDKQP